MRGNHYSNTVICYMEDPGIKDENTHIRHRVRSIPSFGTHSALSESFKLLVSIFCSGESGVPWGGIFTLRPIRTVELLKKLEWRYLKHRQVS